MKIKQIEFKYISLENLLAQAEKLVKRMYTCLHRARIAHVRIVSLPTQVRTGRRRR